MPERPTASVIDDYIGHFPPEVQERLQRVRAIIKECAPGATETISYAIPTFDLDGKHLVHFAAFKKHIGFYPTGEGADAFREEFSAYKSARGSVQFPLDQPLPEDLIRRIVTYRVGQVTGTSPKSGS